MRLRSCLVLLALCSLLPSCTARRLTAHRNTALDKTSRAIAVDAKQRFLVTTEDKDRLRKVCLEPSPDVFSVLSATLEGGAKYKDQASADFKAALAEAAATIGIRTETIQLLRDAMYRICELALNDDLDPNEALTLHLGYQKSMVTLAAVSALADTSRPTQVGLSSRATITRGALLAELSKQLEQAQKDRAAQHKLVETAEETLADSRASVCGILVDPEQCTDPSDATCQPKDGGTALCDGIADEDKAARTQSYCGSHLDASECVQLSQHATELADSRRNLDNTNSTIAQLDHELDETKKNSDLAAVTEIVRLAPTTVQPSPQNIAEVAGVVDRLVTRVYAADAVDRCLTWMADYAHQRSEEATAASQLQKLPPAPLSKATADVETFKNEIRTIATAVPATILENPESDPTAYKSGVTQALTDIQTQARSAATDLKDLVTFCNRMADAYADRHQLSSPIPRTK